jgi:hypothetical protein
MDLRVELLDAVFDQSTRNPNSMGSLIHLGARSA